VSKRNGKYKRNPRDFYPTPPAAVKPLLRHLEPETYFAEPCCGDGDLVQELERKGHVCTYADDISNGSDALDFMSFKDETIITNPPWSRDILHPMIEHFITQAPTWLLIDADWMHTKQARPYMKHCNKIVSIGRVSWMGNGVSGFDNCCWYQFQNINFDASLFYGR
jgi:hypothetical protein